MELNDIYASNHHIDLILCRYVIIVMYSNKVSNHWANASSFILKKAKNEAIHALVYRKCFCFYVNERDRPVNRDMVIIIGLDQLN